MLNAKEAFTLSNTFSNNVDNVLFSSIMKNVEDAIVKNARRGKKNCSFYIDSSAFPDEKEKNSFITFCISALTRLGYDARFYITPSPLWLEEIRIDWGKNE